MKTALLLIVICVASAPAQEVNGETDLYYDSVRNVIYATASSTSDYNTQYYYDVTTNSTMFMAGQYVASQLAPSVYLETPASPGEEVTVDSTHLISVYSYSYDVVCYCYDGYDPYGYDLITSFGDPQSGPTWSVWTWGAPIIVTTVIEQLVGSNESQGKLRAPGDFIDFDVAFRSFVPPLYINGPEGYCGAGPWLAIYAGDNRTYGRVTTAYRWHQSITLLPDLGAGFLPVNQTGLSKRFASDAISSNGQVLYEDQVLNDCYLLDNKGLASNQSMSITTGQPQAHVMTAQFQASVGNPLEPPCCTPSIDSNVSIQVSKTNPSAPTYIIFGAHDCFPAFEGFVGGQQIYGYKPPDYSVATITSCLAGFGQIYPNCSGPVGETNPNCVVP